MSAETRGQLNCCSKEIVVLLDRFAGCGADSDLERAPWVRFCMLVQFALNLDCAADGAGCGYERGHNAIAGVLDLPTPKALRGARIRAEGDLDFRGTLGVSKDVPVGFKEIRLNFNVDYAVIHGHS